jgi:hypothetical protein
MENNAGDFKDIWLSMQDFTVHRMKSKNSESFAAIYFLN